MTEVFLAEPERPDVHYQFQVVQGAKNIPVGKRRPLNLFSLVCYPFRHVGLITSSRAPLSPPSALSGTQRGLLVCLSRGNDAGIHQSLFLLTSSASQQKTISGAMKAHYQQSLWSGSVGLTSWPFCCLGLLWSRLFRSWCRGLVRSLFRSLFVYVLSKWFGFVLVWWSCLVCSDSCSGLVWFRLFWYSLF